MKSYLFPLFSFVILATVLMWKADHHTSLPSPSGDLSNPNLPDLQTPSGSTPDLVTSNPNSSPFSASQSEEEDQLPHSLQELSTPEKNSLWKALSEARREVRPIPKAWSERTENIDYHFYALHPKQALTTRFGPNGVQFVSSERSYDLERDAQSPVTAWKAQMRLLSVAGEKIQNSSQPRKSNHSSTVLEYQHSSNLIEWFDNGTEGIEHGFTIASRPQKLAKGEDVSLEITLEGLHVERQERDNDSESLVFLDAEREILSYSKLVVFDAHGNHLPATMKPTSSGFSISYNDASATYPVTVDPLIVNEQVKLGPADNEIGDSLGSSVAIDGDILVVGATGDDEGGNNAGSAYIFNRINDNWSLQAMLTASDAAADDAFGSAVSVSGETVVIGSPGDDDGGSASGSAYVFVRNGTDWFEEAKLTAFDGTSDNSFGSSLAISGDSVVIGSIGDDENGADSGAVYIFTRAGIIWSQQAKLTAADAVAGAIFGLSVSIDDDYVIVGAPQDNENGNNSGSAYIFTRTGSVWNQQAKLTPDDAATGDQFGFSVAIWYNTVAIGAPGNDDGGDESGSAYIFSRFISNWSQETKLTAYDAAANDQYGYSLALDDDFLVIGAVGEDYRASNTGAAYLYTGFLSSWSLETKLTALGAQIDDQFGWSTAISGETLIVGAPFQDAGASESGSAYVYSYLGGFWRSIKQVTFTGEEDYFGTSVAISGDSLVIGSRRDDDGGSNSGAAYVFTRNGTEWIQEAKLIASDAVPYASFGISVAIENDTIVIGAAHDSEAGLSSGATYIFNRTGFGWSQHSKLTAHDQTNYDYFGSTVAIYGDTIAVGVSSDDDAGSNSGSAYIFTFDGTSWTQQAKLTASDEEAGDYFGLSIGIFDNTVIIGAPYDDDHGSNSGSVYIFTRSGFTWTQQTKLYASDAVSINHFGSSVAIFEDSVLIGCPNNGPGSAYVFTGSGSTWTQEAKLVSSDAPINDNFGGSVAISRDTVVVGASLGNGNEFRSGTAYIFTRNGSNWTEQAKFIASDGASNAEFGNDVAISGDTILIGAYHDNDRGFESGSAYIFRLPQIRAFDSMGFIMENGGSATAFSTLLLDTQQTVSFQLLNAGALGIDIQSISLGGADANQFSLSLPDLSPNPDLTQDQSLIYTITFNPAGTISALRNATVTIISNDIVWPAFTFSISGLGLSGTNDEDADGMNDWGEYSLRTYGFDWQSTQTEEVSHYYNTANSADLFTKSQVTSATDSDVLVDVDPSSNTVALIFTWQESSDLKTFSKHNVNPAKVSVDGNGDIRYEIDTSSQNKFYRAGMKP